MRRRTTEDLTPTQGRDLGDHDLMTPLPQRRRKLVNRRVELDRPDEGECPSRIEVPHHRLDQVFDVDPDVDENVQRLDLGHMDRDETAVGVVNHQIAAERPGGEVVDAAGPVRDVAHDERFDSGAELDEDVGDGGGEEE